MQEQYNNRLVYSSTVTVGFVCMVHTVGQTLLTFFLVACISLLQYYYVFYVYNYVTGLYTYFYAWERQASIARLM